ncbi:MAG: DUF2079 domain-containing protein [Myxococcota bacterium]|nr:DUF2079 domain-containing protein [Myxococcota bacterium]
MKDHKNSIDTVIQRGAECLRNMLLGGGLLNIILVFCIASFVWPVLHLKRFGDLGKNALKWAERIELAQTTGVIFAALYIVLGVWAWRRRRRHREGLFETVAYANTWLLWALALPLVLVAGVPGIEKKHAFLSLAMIMGAAAIIGVWIYRLLGELRGPAANTRPGHVDDGPPSVGNPTTTPNPVTEPADPFAAEPIVADGPSSLAPVTEVNALNSAQSGLSGVPQSDAEDTGAPSIEAGQDGAVAPEPSDGFIGAPTDVERLVSDEDTGAAKTKSNWSAWAAWSALGTMAAAFTYHFSRLAINNHHSFRSQMADLGYYDNIFYQSIHGKPLGCTFLLGEVHYSSHFDPLLVLLSPLYLFYPQAEGILVLQSVWLALGVVPMYLIAKDALQARWLGVVFGGLLLLYAPLHGPALYDFHSLTLLGPLALWLMYCIQRRAWRAFYVVLILCLLTREDISFVMALVGISILISSQPHDRKHGLITIGLAACYFVFVKTSVMISSELLNCTKGGTCFASMFKDLVPAKKGTSEILLSLWSNPSFALAHMFDPRKVTYFLQLFLPLAFLPLLAPRGRVIMLFGVAVIALGTKFALFSIGFQYSTWIYPFAFAITPLALRAVQQNGLRFLIVDKTRLVPTLIGVMVCASLLLTWRYGAIVKNDAFRGGFGRVTYELNDDHRNRMKWLREAVKKIPVDKRLGVTRHMAPHVSNRPFVYPFPTWGRKGKPGHQYLLVRLRDLKKKRKAFRQDIRDGFYKVLAKRGDIYVLKVQDWKKLNRQKEAKARRDKKRQAKRLRASKASLQALKASKGLKKTGTQKAKMPVKDTPKASKRALSKKRRASKKKSPETKQKKRRAKKKKSSKRRRRPRVR